MQTPSIPRNPSRGHLHRKDLLELNYTEKAFFTERRPSRGPLRREKTSGGPLNTEKNFLKVFYTEKIFGRSPTQRRHFGGLLHREVILEIFYTEITFWRSAIQRRLFGGLLHREDIVEVSHSVKIFF